MRVLAEIVLVVVTMFAETLWWQLRKRRKFLRQAIRDETYLRRLISHEALVSPPPRLEPYLQKSAIGYFINVDVLNRADQRSQKVPRIFSLVLLAMVAVGSFHLGYSYLAFNGALFCALGFTPIYGSTKYNAAEHILTLALILYRWHMESPTKCDEWVVQARSLQKLYLVMQEASGAGGTGRT